MNANKKHKSHVYCSVPQCKTYYSHNVSFHKFPNPDKKVLRLKWIHALKMEKAVSPYMLVCNKHFRDEDFFFNRRYVNKNYRLKANVVPSQNLPRGSHDKKVNEEKSLQRQQRIVNRHKSKDASKNAVQIVEVVESAKTSELDAAEAFISLGHSNSKNLLSTKGMTCKTYRLKNNAIPSVYLLKEGQIRREKRGKLINKGSLAPCQTEKGETSAAKIDNETNEEVANILFDDLTNVDKSIQVNISCEPQNFCLG